MGDDLMNRGEPIEFRRTKEKDAGRDERDNEKEIIVDIILFWNDHMRDAPLGSGSSVETTPEEGELKGISLDETKKKPSNPLLW